MPPLGLTNNHQVIYNKHCIFILIFSGEIWKNNDICDSNHLGLKIMLLETIIWTFWQFLLVLLAGSSCETLTKSNAVKSSGKHAICNIYCSRPTIVLWILNIEYVYCLQSTKKMFYYGHFPCPKYRLLGALKELGLSHASTTTSSPADKMSGRFWRRIKNPETSDTIKVT